jgi:hypothetical protein
MATAETLTGMLWVLVGTNAFTVLYALYRLNEIARIIELNGKTLGDILKGVNDD